MSILSVTKEIDDQLVPMKDSQTKLAIDKIYKTYPISEYNPSEEEKQVRTMIIRQFALGDITMQRPRQEFNDLSVLGRQTYDYMQWNAYQPNNGDGLAGDELNSWKSNALRPIVRNKCVSIAAHATARLIFPKVFAYSGEADQDKDAAQVMRDLIEWASDKSAYAEHSLMRTITALVEPASIGYQEYIEVYRDVKKEKDENGKWKVERVLDEYLSGFQNVVVPVNELYIENIFEPDIQKQGWLIWRKVISYSLAETKYSALYKNFKHVHPGVQLIYNDANQTFYQVYDTNMRPDMVEEIVYWNRNLDLKIIMVNGVMMTDADNPNPRNDKMYPFDKFGYEVINNKFFYYKSLASKMMQDAKIINDLYKMIIDGTYLNLMPPMINIGGEAITSDVIVPGAVTTLSDPSADLKVLSTANTNTLQAAMNTAFKVDESINQSSQEPIQSGQQAGGSNTAYEISRIEQNANTVLGLFLKMIAKHVKDFGVLRMGDIIQYMTIADVNKLEDNAELVYKSFLMPESKDSNKSKKIKFKGEMKDKMTGEEKLTESFRLLKEGGEDAEIWEVNPQRFRDLKYELSITADVITPKSEDLMKAYNLEAYDRMIANPMANQEEAFRMLLSSYDVTKRNPDKFIMEQQPMQMNPMQLNNNQPAGVMANKLPQTAPTLNI